MNKIVCNSIEYVFVNEIEMMYFNQIRLKSGSNWEKLDVISKPIYHSEIKLTQAGPLKEETITAKTKYLPNRLHTHSSFKIILRLQTDNETFFVGSTQFPVTIEISTNKVFDNYSFKAKSTP